MAREFHHGSSKKDTLVTLAVFAVAAVICINNTVATPTEPNQVSYKGVARLRAMTARKEDRDFVLQMNSLNRSIDAFFVRFLNATEITVKKEDFGFLKNELTKAGIEYIVFTEDMQESIDQVAAEIRHKKLKKKSADFDPFNFYTYEEVRAYLLKLGSENDMVNTVNLGLTHEGRDILMSSVTLNNASSAKPIIYMDCAIHSNEWITGTVCLWVLNELSTKYGKDSEVTTLLDNYDWYIKPLSNPDGYAYTWTTDRMWRKNRSPNKNSTCYGTDLNRNFDSTFGPISSGLLDPCSRQYKGAYDFSEAETQATVSVLTRFKNRIGLALFFHSFTQLWLSAYAANSTLPLDYPEMERVMKVATAAIRSAGWGTEYLYGSFGSLLYNATGTVTDYAYGKLGIIHSYLIELPDQGEHGFVMPVTKIEPIVLETWNGIKAAAFAVLKN